MGNHEKRSQRAVMLASLEEYKSTSEYEVLTEAPIRRDRFIEAMGKRISQAFESGYKRGRASAKSKKA